MPGTAGGAEPEAGGAATTAAGSEASLRSPRRLAGACRTLLVLLLLLVLFPWVGVPLNTGLDPSYVWGVNALAVSAAVPGRDVAFPYGPFGFVIVPENVGSNLVHALAVRLLLHALLGLAVGWAAWRFASTARLLEFLFLYVLAVVLGLAYEYQLLLVAAMLLAPALVGRPRLPLAAPLAALLAVFFFLVRINLGVAAMGLVAVYLLAGAAQRREGRWRELASTLAVFAAAAGVAAFTVFHGPGNALAWLRAEADLASGFASAQSLEGPGQMLAAGWIALGLYLLLAGWAWLRRGDLRWLWIALLPPVLIVFKHGFVRQDGHVLYFFSFLAGVLAVGSLFARQPRELSALHRAHLAALLLVVPAALAYLPGGGRRQIDLVVGRAGIANLRTSLDLAATRANLGRVSARQLEADRLPRALVRPIRQADLGVDSVPWELSLVAANGLRWVPNPVLQLYTAYTARLDDWEAEHFSGPRAPDVLFVRYDSFDERNMLWDTPAVWRAIAARYEPAPAQPVAGLLVLRRRAEPAAWVEAEARREEITFGEWVAVPESAEGEWLSAALELRLRLRGRLRLAAFRLPPLYAEVERADGRTMRWRLVPGTLANGPLLNRPPRDLAELAALLRGEPGVRALRFRIGGPGVSCFAPRAAVTWRPRRLTGPPSLAP